MGNQLRRKVFVSLIGSTVIFLASCDKPLDFDLRGLGDGFNTSDAARQVTATRPQADDRGVISYPNYQVVVARPGDRLADISARIGISAQELGSYNGISQDVVLKANEVVALPRRVEEPSPQTGALGTGPILPGSEIDITSLAGNAIERAGNTDQTASNTTAQTGVEPIRHKVQQGETAFSIARIYNISVRSLSEWNGLGPDLSVRSGQFLLIPVVLDTAQSDDQTSTPGQGTLTPVPPSAATALPDPAETTPAAAPPSPDLGSNQTADTAQLAMPTDGKIIRTYVKGKNDGIDIAAPAGTPVFAAADGTVAAITRDTGQVPILVLKHANNLLTVYAGVAGLKVEKGAKVKRGQKIAEIRASEPSFLHFEVRKGLNSVDPMQYLN
ncbi:MAG: peptidoglycan DD-metalloendopeptidase family protein [Paracoccaceae bacterium]